MKINKLLFFLLAVFSLNSCVEYVNNGVVPDGPEKPEEQVYTAEVANLDEAKYVGDKFEFKAMLNNVDVTASSKFKVNGVATTNNASFYIPHKTGVHSVIATMDDYEATFKFTVEEKEEEPEPEPTGNRIEYNSTVYPMSTTQWYLYFKSDGTLYYEPVNGVPHSVWAMVSMDNNDLATADDYFMTIVMVPMKQESNGQYSLLFPNEVSSSSLLHVSGSVYINGAEVFESTNATVTIAATGNTIPQGTLDPNKFPWTATSNYTITATGASSGNSAELFWQGNHTINGTKLKAKASKPEGFIPTKSFIVNKGQIKNLKIAK